MFQQIGRTGLSQGQNRKLGAVQFFGDQNKKKATEGLAALDN